MGDYLFIIIIILVRKYEIFDVYKWTIHVILYSNFNIFSMLLFANKTIVQPIKTL